MSEPRLADLPPIATSRLELRPLRLADAEVFRAMTDDPAITEVVDLLATPFGLADAERLLAGKGDGRDVFWGIRLRDAPGLAGTVGTHLVDDDEIEIGYWLVSARHRRGYAVEAVGAMLGALAAAYPSRRIFAECRPENAASWRLLLRLGFAPNGEGHRAGRLRLVRPEGAATPRHAALRRVPVTASASPRAGP